MLQAVEAILEPSGQVRLLEAIRVTAPTRVVLTLLEPSAPAEPAQGDSAAVLRFLRANRLPDSARLDAAAIDAQIDAERQAWD